MKTIHQKPGLKIWPTSLTACMLLALFCGGSNWSPRNSLSDAEKMKVIEEMAQAISEKKVFFQWLKSEEREDFIQDRVFTQERYEDIMNNPDPKTGGAGVYVAENVSSSSKFGPAIMQVEIEPNTLKYIDLTDPKVVKDLAERGVMLKEVRALNPKNVVIKYDGYNEWWLIKGREGVTFKPVNKPAVMSQISPRTAGFVLSNQARTGVKLSTEEERQIIKEAISLIRKSEDGSAILSSASKYLSPSDKRQVMDQSLSLIQSSADGLNLLNGIHKADPLSKDPLTKEDKAKVLEKTFPYFKDNEDGRFFLKQTQKILSEEDQLKILTVAGLKAKSAQVAQGLFNEFEKDFTDTTSFKKVSATVQRVWCLEKQLNGT